jgi:hypothetical protein
MGTPYCSCYTVYRYPPVSSYQLFHPLHNCFCRNLSRATWSGVICDFRTPLSEFLDPVVNRFTRWTFPTVNMKHFFMNILCIESFCPQKTQKQLCSSVGHSSSTVTILTTATSLRTMRMCVCYLYCHETGLCCYLVIDIETLLRPLQLFYFRLWSVYWLFLVLWEGWFVTKWRSRYVIISKLLDSTHLRYLFADGVLKHTGVLFRNVAWTRYVVTGFVGQIGLIRASSFTITQQYH